MRYILFSAISFCSHQRHLGIPSLGYHSTKGLVTGWQYADIGDTKKGSTIIAPP